MKKQRIFTCAHFASKMKMATAPTGGKTSAARRATTSVLAAPSRIDSFPTSSTISSSSRASNLCSAPSRSAGAEKRKASSRASARVSALRGGAVRVKTAEIVHVSSGRVELRLPDDLWQIRESNVLSARAHDGAQPIKTSTDANTNATTTSVNTTKTKNTLSRDAESAHSIDNCVSIDTTMGQGSKVLCDANDQAQSAGLSQPLRSSSLPKNALYEHHPLPPEQQLADVFLFESQLTRLHALAVRRARFAALIIGAAVAFDLSLVGVAVWCAWECGRFSELLYVSQATWHAIAQLAPINALNMADAVLDCPTVLPVEHGMAYEAVPSLSPSPCFRIPLADSKLDPLPWLVGVTLLFSFALLHCYFSGTFHRLVEGPRRFISRINLTLRHFHVAFDGSSRKVLFLDSGPPNNGEY